MKRTFKADDVEDLRWRRETVKHDDFTVIERRELGMEGSRWFTGHEVVFRDESDGTYWLFYYRLGATEYQEHEELGDEVVCPQVHQVERTVTVWERAGLQGGVPTGNRKIYLASSWRNPAQPEAVEILRQAGHEVYDFRNPALGDSGFSWSAIDPYWEHWTPEKYVEALQHPLAVDGFAKDFAAMEWADTFVLLLPCGRSAHLEAGWAVGAGREVYVVHPDGEEPELMAKMATAIVPTVSDVLDLLKGKVAA